MDMEKLKKLDEIIDELHLKSIKEICISKDEKFIQSIPYEITLNNGKKIIREKLIKGKSGGNASIIIPVVEGQILTVVEPRVFTEKTVGIGFPAGYTEGSESHLEGAIRELREETGYESSNFIYVDAFYQDQGCSSAAINIYLALDCKKVSDQKLDEGEFIKYMFFSYDELLELEKMNYIMGADAKLALAKIEKYFKET